MYRQENKGRWQSGTVLAAHQGFAASEARCIWKVQRKVNTTCIPLSLFSWLAWGSDQFWLLSSLQDKEWR